MHEYAQDAMSYVRHYSTPGLFITFTCNRQWTDKRIRPKEINLISEGRPDNEENSLLHEVQSMIHGPCGILNPNLSEWLAENVQNDIQDD